MKISLLFPPTWHPSQPYLSLPSLTGFLAQGGVTNVSQRDLGIELLDKVVTHSYGVGLYQELVDKQRMLEQKRIGDTGPGSAEHLARVVESLDRFPYLIDRIEPAFAGRVFMISSPTRKVSFSSTNGWRCSPRSIFRPD
jgi:anaerobic magnesium-protoporphyrin IX monomethyl ester cyclase